MQHLTQESASSPTRLRERLDLPFTHSRSTLDTTDIETLMHHLAQVSAIHQYELKEDLTYHLLTRNPPSTQLLSGTVKPHLAQGSAFPPTRSRTRALLTISFIPHAISTLHVSSILAALLGPFPSDSVRALETSTIRVIATQSSQMETYDQVSSRPFTYLSIM